jgi:2,4-dienoyl-CoA reductase-like NADH-dependent reductase (Old Yellow Enzyme family)
MIFILYITEAAQGGTGLIIVEATGVEPRGRITNHCMGIWNDEQAEKLKKIVDFVHQNSESKIGISLLMQEEKALPGIIFRFR